jgi:Transglutaminase-like superfamily
VAHTIDYARPGLLTDLTGVDPAVLAGLPADPVGICRSVTSLILHPMVTGDLVLPASRLEDNQLRPAASIIDALLRLDSAPLDVPRDPDRRVVGTCRHFVIVSCALLRHAGLAARARCGFGTYFRAGLALDHWITEYWHDGQNRWVRVDTQHLEHGFTPRPHDLQPGEFLTGGEAWLAYRSGEADGASFGVDGTENFGPGEIRGNAVRDLAALNKIEMLPWDEWGRMTASYQGETGADYDVLMDEIAAACAADDADAVARLYASADLAVPRKLIR